jgi:hypothetical protein
MVTGRTGTHRQPETTGKQVTQAGGSPGSMDTQTTRTHRKKGHTGRKAKQAAWIHRQPEQKGWQIKQAGRSHASRAFRQAP